MNKKQVISSISRVQQKLLDEQQQAARAVKEQRVWNLEEELEALSIAMDLVRSARSDNLVFKED
jgi:hypothetical protein